MENNILSQLINNLPQYIWWKDLNSTFLGCNDNLLYYLELKHRKELVGKTDYELFSKKEADAFTKTDREIMSTGKAQLNFEECITLPGQGKRWLSTSKVPMFDDDKNIIGTIGMFSDITALKTMQITIDEHNKELLERSYQLEQANKALELANIDLEKFTFATSHDLKGPVRTMINFADLLKEKEENNLDDTSLQYIDFICSSANRMGTLIDDILNYARTGAEELVSKPIDLKSLVARKIIDMKLLINSKSAVLNINLPTDKVNCYPHMIGLIFNNLIINGIKYNQSSTPTINCTYSESEDYWVFLVEDNGIGINPKFAKQIFEPFRRLVGENYEGSGIGLSICKRVAKLHNGDIWLEETKQGNTVFKFNISKNL
ncbi:MAG: PAS domain S-box-containing protein [Chitinophagales bacterium]|jgi:PAS domain S-box-containing protein